MEEGEFGTRPIRIRSDVKVLADGSRRRGGRMFLYYILVNERSKAEYVPANMFALETGTGYSIHVIRTTFQVLTLR